MTPSLRCCAGTLLPLLLTTGCAIPQLDVTPRYGQLSLEGSFGADAGDVTATASLEDAGLDDDEGIPGLRADLKFGSPHLVLSAGRASWSGTGTVDATLNAGGMTIPAGATVDSDLDLDLYSGLLLWDVFPGKTVEVAIGFGATVFDFDLAMADQGSGMEISSAETLPVPVLAANVGVQLGGIELAALVSGFSLSLDDNEGRFVDADVFARWHVLGGKNHVRSSLILGWRQVDLDVEYEDGGDAFEAEVTLSGPYLGLEITL